MPTYRVSDPQRPGKFIKLTGDSPPTEEEIGQIFDQVHGKLSAGSDQPSDFLKQNLDFKPPTQPVESKTADGRAYSPQNPLSETPETYSDFGQNVLTSGLKRAGQAVISPAASLVNDASEHPVRTAAEVATPLGWGARGLRQVTGFDPMSGLGSLFRAASGGQAPQAADFGDKTGMLPTMGRQVTDYGGQAVDAAKRGDKLAAVTRAIQSVLSGVPVVSASVPATDTNVPLSEALGNAGADVGMMAAGADELPTPFGEVKVPAPGKVAGKALEAGIPGLLKSPEAAYAKVLPDTAKATGILERTPSLPKEMVDEGIWGKAKTLKKETKALTKERKAVRQAEGEAAAGMPVTTDKMADALKEYENNALGSTGDINTALDRPGASRARVLQQQVSNMTPPIEHVLAGSGGSLPSAVMKPGLTMEDLLQRVKSTPKVEGEFDRVRTAGAPETELSAPFGQVEEFKQYLDKMNQSLADQKLSKAGAGGMGFDTGAGGANATAANAARDILGTASPAYGKAAKAESRAIDMRKLVAGIKDPKLLTMSPGDVLRHVYRKSAGNPALVTGRAVAQARLAQLLNSGVLGDLFAASRTGLNPQPDEQTPTE